MAHIRRIEFIQIKQSVSNVQKYDKIGDNGCRNDSATYPDTLQAPMTQDASDLWKIIDLYLGALENASCWFNRKRNSSISRQIHNRLR